MFVMEHKLRMDSNHKTLSVHKDDLIEIDLDETPTAGFNWEIESIDESNCELVSSEYHVYAGAGIGGGGFRSMIFRIKNPGNCTIKLKNWQRWSGDIYQQFEVKVVATTD